MALMMGNLYEALHKAGASPDEARKAAEEVAGFENRLVSIGDKVEQLYNRLDKKIDQLEGSLNRRTDQLEASMTRRTDQLEAKFERLSWMVGVAIALILLVLGRTFFQ